ncbi:hypothetical protein M433DRAFT_1739 [Acidomyces richmondensis BFW]|nr:MAG: hypothetical protein FE78DRAFT_137377 [Acidomyces sp. 'richmondensis']KYG48763.1 hypothetical protein M433DRAFT_1739 [Acidomyces richmondensis BFW]
MVRAVQLVKPGPAALALKIVDIPKPMPKHGQVLIRVKAFGLNRSELFTRLTGRAPLGDVPIGRVLGIEAVGQVESAPGYEEYFPKGATVMTAMGGMGIAFDGGYAEYICVSKTNVQVLKNQTKLGWDVLGALPEMLQSAHGSLFRGLKLKEGDTLLIRGGTTSVGFAAAAMANNAGATVITTTRRADRNIHALLKEHGAEHVIVDDGKSICNTVKNLYPSGINKILELVGGATVADSISCLAKDGICCFVGMVGGAPVFRDFNPLLTVPTERYLTAYGERTFNANNFPLDDLVEQIDTGKLKVRVGKVFTIDRIAEAHECMEKNEACGKIVVLTGM